MQGEEVAKVEDFKYLGSTVQSNGECGREVKKRVQAGWNGWRRMSGVICDRRVSARVKGKVNRVAVRPAMLYGLETVALTKRQEAEMEVAELKMLRFSLGVTRMDKIRNEYIRGTAQVGRFGEKTREARLRWYGHVLRKDDGYIGRRMLKMELPGKRKRGRPKRRFMDVVKEDMAEVEVKEEDADDRSNWRLKIRCGDPWWEKAERRRRRTAQETGAGGRSGAAGIPVHGSLMGRFSLCTWLLSLFFCSNLALWLALWYCQVKQSVRWHCSGHQHRLVWSGWCVPWSVFHVCVWFHLCTRVQGPDRILSRILPHTSSLSASCVSGVRGWNVECSRVCGTH